VEPVLRKVWEIPDGVMLAAVVVMVAAVVVAPAIDVTGVDAIVFDVSGVHQTVVEVCSIAVFCRIDSAAVVLSSNQLGVVVSAMAVVMIPS
jgi:hypothetical protein